MTALAGWGRPACFLEPCAACLLRFAEVHIVFGERALQKTFRDRGPGPVAQLGALPAEPAQNGHTRPCSRTDTVNPTRPHFQGLRTWGPDIWNSSALHAGGIICGSKWERFDVLRPQRLVRWQHFFFFFFGKVGHGKTNSPLYFLAQNCRWNKGREAVPFEKVVSRTGGNLVELVVKPHRSSCTRASVVPAALRGRAAPTLPPTPAAAWHHADPWAPRVPPAVPSCREGFVVPSGSQACWTALSQGPRRTARWILLGRPARGFLRWGAPCGPVTCEPCILAASVWHRWHVQ